MKKIFFLAVTTALLAACQTTQLGPTPPIPSTVSFAGGDGSSVESAVLIKGATESTGVQAEYGWLAQHYPRYRMGEQSLQKHGARLYDAMEITTSDGTRKTVYFDISEFYGKL